MTRAVSATEAKNRFGTVLDWVIKDGDEVVVERQGRPLAAILSMAAYDDPKDNDLIAHAVLNHVDYVITGDHDVLDLAAQLHPLQIIQPADFAREVLEIDQP